MSQVPDVRFNVNAPVSSLMLASTQAPPWSPPFTANTSPSIPVTALPDESTKVPTIFLSLVSTVIDVVDVDSSPDRSTSTSLFML